jgi:hypothetical protein
VKAVWIVGAALALPIAAVTVYGMVRTHNTERDPLQREFANGRIPAPALEGLYQGSLPGREVPWKGKKFHTAAGTGINIFRKADGSIEERYPFRTHVGRGAKDKRLDVLKIDYDIPGNPFWLRRILDEVVEVAPGRLVGKVHVRWILGMKFTFAFFKLEKPASLAPARPSATETGSGAS